jgi:hypothetical protein
MASTVFTVFLSALAGRYHEPLVRIKTRSPADLGFVKITKFTENL